MAEDQVVGRQWGKNSLLVTIAPLETTHRILRAFRQRRGGQRQLPTCNLALAGHCGTAALQVGGKPVGEGNCVQEGLVRPLSLKGRHAVRRVAQQRYWGPHSAEATLRAIVRSNRAAVAAAAATSRAHRPRHVGRRLQGRAVVDGISRDEVFRGGTEDVGNRGMPLPAAQKCLLP